MLAKDRRRETYLLIVFSIMLLIELWVLPFFSKSVVHTISLVVLVLSVCIAVFTVVWNCVRCFRLYRKRPVFFVCGLVLWTLGLVCSVIAHWCPVVYYMGVPVSWVVVFVCVNCVVSMFANVTRSRFVHEIGWPILKRIHWLYLGVVLVLYMVGLLSLEHVLLYTTFGLFLVARYAYNRWIYATRVVYPYKPTAAKFYIKQMR